MRTRGFASPDFSGFAIIGVVLLDAYSVFERFLVRPPSIYIFLPLFLLKPRFAEFQAQAEKK
jgi:hypothetical protein